MTSYEYYIKEAIKQARHLYAALEGKNSTFNRSKKLFEDEGGSGSWDIKTPVSEAINSECEYNLITMASEITFGDTNKISLTALGCPSNISAYCKRMKDSEGVESAQVVVTRDNYCWRRYFISKEILHLFMYDGDNVTDTETLLKDLITDLLECDPSTITDSNAQYNADKAAYFGAIELLIPSEYVPALIEAKNEMIRDGGYTGDENLEIARTFSVPEKLVEFRLDERHQHLFE